MAKRILFLAFFMILASTSGLGQSSFQGLTPGKSTRAAVERVLGQPIRSVSKTLVEYTSSDAALKLYVQYSDDSTAPIVDRIELTCFDDDEVNDRCGPVLKGSGQLDGVLEDAFSNTIKQEDLVLVRYYGAPRFMVWTFKTRGVNSEQRLAFYSKSLYESAVPKGGCTGTIFGTWQTERGRVTIVRVGDDGVQGTYAKNNGSFSLKRKGSGYAGEWKDDTGSGTMALLLDDNSFTASLSRGGAAAISSKQTTKRSEAGAKPGSVLEQINKAGTGAAVGAIITEPSGGLSRVTGLPPGEPLTGKCVP